MAEALLQDKRRRPDGAAVGASLVAETARRTEAQAPAPTAAGGSVLSSLTAGALAGALAKTVIAPLDRTKINFQVSATPYSWRAALRWLSAAAQAEGVAALWRGNSATLARIAPYAAVQFAAHEQWKKALGVDDMNKAKGHPLRLLLAGALAGVTSQTATYPLDLARARMAVAQGHATLPQILRDLVKDEGARTLYRGYGATVLGVVPYAGVSFFTYDTLKRIFTEQTGTAPGGWARIACGGAAGALGQTASYPLDIVRRRTNRHAPGGWARIACGGAAGALGQTASYPLDIVRRRSVSEQTGTAPGGWARIACGGAAGALGQTASYPLDIVRRRMQTARRHKDGGYPYATMVETLRLVYRTEGWRGFFKGLSMNWVKGPVAAGVSFATYDYIRALFARLA